MPLRLKMTWPEDELPVRLPVTRPVKLWCTYTVFPKVFRNNILPFFSIVAALVALKPNSIPATSPENLQVKLTDELIRLLTVIPWYGKINCILPTEKKKKETQNFFFFFWCPRPRVNYTVIKLLQVLFTSEAIVLRCFDIVFQKPYWYFSLSLSDHYKIFANDWL